MVGGRTARVGVRSWSHDFARQQVASVTYNDVVLVGPVDSGAPLRRFERCWTVVRRARLSMTWRLGTELRLSI